MRTRLFILTIALLILVLPACAPAAEGRGAAKSATAPVAGIPMDKPAPFPDPRDACPVTQPPATPFLPPKPYHAADVPAGHFWHGTPDLWTIVPSSGAWEALPRNPQGYTQKLFFWRYGYSWREEPNPALTVTARRLDDKAPEVHVADATNAYASDIQSAMLVGVDFPTAGCWEITGQYGDHALSYVVWVAP